MLANERPCAPLIHNCGTARGVGAEQLVHYRPMISDPIALQGVKPALLHPPGYRARRFRNWILLGLLYASYYLCRYNLSTVTPELAREFKLNNEQTGLMSTGRDIGYAIGTFVNGLFADALGGKQAMAIGAIGTILLNLAFGFFSTWTALDAAVLIGGFAIIRTLDGYAQSFGSPGMVKINAAWFHRTERGRFAGIFGAVIQLGQIGVTTLSAKLLTGFAVGVFGVTLFVVAEQNWRIMFVVPPMVLAVVLVAMWLGVRNYPEEAGFRIHQEAEQDTGAPPPKLPLGLVFRTIAGNPIVWVNAGAYMCTGFVRRAYDFWWAKYLDNTWHIGKGSPEFIWLGLLLPIAAVVGSFSAGFLSDAFFKSRRSPVAFALYAIETIVILAAIWVLGYSGVATPFLACVFLTLISLTCNSSHSIIGTAAVMDIGGRQMSGFALGVINSCQYFGAILAGYSLGGLIDKFGWNAMFLSMAPFSALGMFLMLGVWLSTRGREVRGS